MLELLEVHLYLIIIQKVIFELQKFHLCGCFLMIDGMTYEGFGVETMGEPSTVLAGLVVGDEVW